MQRQSLQANDRKVFGRKVSQIRVKGLLPGNIYGRKLESRSVSVDVKEFAAIFSKTGETGLIDIIIDNKKIPVLVHQVQLDPIKGLPLHVDFHQVDLKEKISAQIPVEVVGESPAEKQNVGTVVQYLNEIEIEALPTDLPENFTVDVSQLENVDQQITVADLKVDTGKIEVLENPESIIVKVEPPQKEEVPVAAPVEAIEEQPSATEESSGETQEEKPKEE